jgi:V/A-type H+-transporting ATPase subunit F
MSIYRIAIVGNRNATRGFSLLGVDVVQAETSHEAFDQILALKKMMEKDDEGHEYNRYAIIFVIEHLIEHLSADDQRKLSRGALPAIVPVPSPQGSTGFGLARLKQIVERAVGSNILQ